MASEASLQLRKEFVSPGAEFAPMPFWFLNDLLEPQKMLAELADYRDRGVGGVVIHPRIGMSSPEYMSDEYLALVEECVKFCSQNGMRVILYDEACYPSGSAHGMVAAENPLFAARCLRPEHWNPEHILAPYERLVALYAVNFDTCECFETDPEAELPAGCDRIAFIEAFTGGTIRGLAPDEDDRQPNAPKAADLLNIEATRTFIRLTHEKYLSRLGKYFGDTVIAFFTDEPSLSGRAVNMHGKRSWSEGFIDDLRAEYPEITLPALFFEFGEESARAESAYARAIHKRLERCFYAPISEWCEAHGIALTGHPAESSDIGLERRFQIPGQDVVWRSVEPGNYLGRDSVLAKCSADAARHLGARRNLNECCGACGKRGNPWVFPFGDMIWYFNFLLARGVNLLSPHAFYYSLRTPVQWDERPPDLGPGNIWWPWYPSVAAYVSRLCWLNTDSRNSPCAAVLCRGNRMPYACPASLYENNMDFNYLDADVMEARAVVRDGRLEIAGYSYSAIFAETPLDLSLGQKELLRRFQSSGGRLLMNGDFASYVKLYGLQHDSFSSYAPDLRISRIYKNGVPFLLLCNEGDTPISGSVITDIKGLCENWDPESGEIAPIYSRLCGGLMEIPVELKQRGIMIISVSESEPLYSVQVNKRKLVYLQTLGDTASGGVFRTSHLPAEKEKVFLCFDEVCDLAEITVNRVPLPPLMRAPWRSDITALLRPGKNLITLSCRGGMANRYGTPVRTGLFGARLEGYAETEEFSDEN